ncbi:hypothetical protein CKM354_001246600 [Cercospora kikuchii]|uniref:Uncharacterized protein n=1 Tax=Cercospora kikuchii TaxID=84275 RepID=A0A9P3L134_9PEZI|nr:uncharacterized protein CKM354_001246600 [Cercospora kikuchii]GIZ49436.1 hypothetical protein CKM354_001246600 [Cercospora kikuchii]
MKLLMFVTLLSCLTTVSGQAQSIVDALQLVQQGIRYSDSLVYRFDGNPYTGALDAINIQESANQVGHAVEYCIAVANASPLLNDQDSGAVAVAILSLRPDVETLLKRIISKKWNFDQVVVGLFSVSKQVQQALTDQKAQTIALGNAVASKLSGAYRQAAPLLLEEFSASFDSAIAAFVPQSMDYSTRDSGILIQGVCFSPTHLRSSSIVQ